MKRGPNGGRFTQVSLYVLLFDESLNQQLKKKPAGHPSYTRIKLNLNRKLKGLCCL